MISRIFSDIWRYGTEFTDSGGGSFRGFLESVDENEIIFTERKKQGAVRCDEYRLIAQATEDFPTQRHTVLTSADGEYELLSARAIMLEGEITHYECIVRGRTANA